MLSHLGQVSRWQELFLSPWSQCCHCPKGVSRAHWGLPGVLSFQPWAERAQRTSPPFSLCRSLFWDCFQGEGLVPHVPVPPPYCCPCPLPAAILVHVVCRDVESSLCSELLCSFSQEFPGAAAPGASVRTGVGVLLLTLPFLPDPNAGSGQLVPGRDDRQLH